MHTVLVVDDNSLIVEMLQQLLEPHYLVQVAANGKLGVEWARRHRPDVVLMDLTMPVMDGFAAITALRADAATAKVPIIALSARGDREDVDRALRVGADAHQKKPVEEKELLAEIARLLAR